MSYYINLEVKVSEPTDFDIGSIAAAIWQRLDSDGISRNVFADLKATISEGKAMLKVHGAYVVSLVEFVHEQVPDLIFSARGWGEEIDDPWIRAFRKEGKRYSSRPFDLTAFNGLNRLGVGD